MPDLLLELFSEEIPARCQRRAAEDLKRLVTDAIDADLPTLTGWRAYLCGSPPMVEATTLLVRRKGIAPEHIHADAFYPQGT